AEREQREAARGEQLAAGLAALAQTEVAAAADTQVVVDEAHRRQRDDQRQQREARAGELDLLRAEVGDDVAEERADDDRDPAHRRRAGLAGVRVRERTVVADHLPDPPGPQHPDQQRRPQHGDRERDPGGDQERDHRFVVPPLRTSATRSSPTARLAFTSTASPEPTSSPAAASAPSASATSTTVARPAVPEAIAPDTGPTATTTSIPSSAASAPSAVCSAAVC